MVYVYHFIASDRYDDFKAVFSVDTNLFCKNRTGYRLDLHRLQHHYHCGGNDFQRYVKFVSKIVSMSLTCFVVDMPGGDAGLAISSGLGLAGMSQWGVRQSCEFER